MLPMPTTSASAVKAACIASTCALPTVSPPPMPWRLYVDPIDTYWSAPAARSTGQCAAPRMPQSLMQTASLSFAAWSAEASFVR